MKLQERNNIEVIIKNENEYEEEEEKEKPIDLIESKKKKQPPAHEQLQIIMDGCFRKIVLPERQDLSSD